MKSSASAPDPDPNIGKAALMQAETGQQWLNFAKDAFDVSTDRQAELDALTTKVTEQQLGLATDQANWAREDRQRYTDVYKPVEDAYIEEATNYATDARQDEAAAEARADVQTAAANQRAATERQTASMGINPGSGRFAGIQATNDMNATLAEAGAANTARQTVRDKGLALKADVANMGRGYASSAGSSAGSSVGASATALSGAQASNAQSLAANNIMSQGYSGAMQGYAGMGSTLNQQYGIQSNNWQASQNLAGQNAAGFGSFLGGLFALSDEDLKENKEPIPDGAALDAVNDMRVEGWNYKPGVQDDAPHFGTYAQDWQKATGTGDGHSIPLQDAIGLTMKAVQDLDQKVDKLSMIIGLGMTMAAEKEEGEEETESGGEMENDDAEEMAEKEPRSMSPRRRKPMVIGIAMDKEAA